MVTPSAEAVKFTELEATLRHGQGAQESSWWSQFCQALRYQNGSKTQI